MAIFAPLALTLALTGVYAAISYSVTQATQEIGISRELVTRRRLADADGGGAVAFVLMVTGLSCTMVGHPQGAAHWKR